MSGFNNPIIGGGGALVYPSIHSPNFVTGVSGWSINKDGSAEFDNLTLRGTFLGLDWEINSAGAFFYSGVPAAGNLIASIAPAAGTDPFGNAYAQGITAYSSSANVANVNLLQGLITWLASGLVSNAYGTAIGSGGSGRQPVLQFAPPDDKVSPPRLLSLIGTNQAGTLSPQVLVGTSIGLPAPLTSALLEVQGITSIVAAASGGQVLTVQDTVGAPTSSIIEIIAQAASDNSLGVMVNGDTFNRLKFTPAGVLAGPGNATQDVRLLRAAAARWLADVIAWNNAGSAETQHSLGGISGGLGVTTVWADYTMLVTGEVLVNLEVNVTTAQTGPLVFVNTMPAAYRPVTDNIRVPMNNNSAAGSVARAFVGTNGSVQIVAQSGNLSGVYDAHFTYLAGV